MRLTKAQAAKLAEHQRVLRADRELLEARFIDLLAKIGAARQEFNLTVRDHNVHVAAARAFVTATAEALRDDLDSRSDRWRESEAGQAAEDMVQEWEDAALHDVEPVQVLEPDRPFYEEGLNLPEDDGQ